VATKRRSVNLVKEVDKKQKLEGAEAEKQVDEKQKVEITEAEKEVLEKKKVERTEAEKEVHEKRKVKSTEAEKAVAKKKKKVESIYEESDESMTIYPMDNLCDDYDDDTSSEEELTPSGMIFVSIRKE
ncbi:hypothetical protein A2U01_0008121, partial [Trifolium medium]|nr:hypothetical protein [Trifolium medium]